MTSTALKLLLTSPVGSRSQTSFHKVLIFNCTCLQPSYSIKRRHMNPCLGGVGGGGVLSYSFQKGC